MLVTVLAGNARDWWWGVKGCTVHEKVTNTGTNGFLKANPISVGFGYFV